MLKHFEHVGMTCSDLDRTVAFYCGLLGLATVLRKTLPDGGQVAFLDAGGGMLEIVQPAGAVRTPARAVRRDEAGIRHLTLAVDDLQATYAALLAAGVRFIEAPRAAVHDEVLRKVAFCLDPDGIVVELAER